ncbi:hypothetical protein BurJ1DRAFT_0710 [Burkholderiales bacterium JOSHI_001]|nr:hypothetical protein BurJ1DRAFT_0710 [Burkholderiales bacterium JOSHI_001]
MKRRTFSLATGLAFTPWPSHGAEPLVNAGVVLLQPESVLQSRVKDAAEFAAYMQQVEGAAAQALKAAFQRKPVGGFIVLALRPERKCKVWLDLDGELPAPTRNAVVQNIEALAAPQVQDGLVVFALKASFWGGRPPTRVAPAPAEWKAAAEQAGSKLAVEALVDRLWLP